MSEQHAIRYWRSLDELDNTPEFQEFLSREFPVAASEFPEGVSRRRWMQLMGASFALASVAGCRWETEKFAPFLHRPEGYVPGKPVKYATTIEWGGAPRHLLVTSYDGRPIKIEGNPEHPGSLGATNTYSQAATLSLYDPDRSRGVYERDGKESFGRTWADFDAFVTARRDELKARQGAGLAFLLDPTTSVSMASLLTRLAEEMPQAKVYEYAPLADTNAAEGRRLAFGQALRPHFKLDQAKVVACFDADVLGSHPNSTRLARDWAKSREVKIGDEAASSTMSRLYAIESQFSLTGASADHRFPLQSQAIGQFLVELRDQINARLAGEAVLEPKDSQVGSETLTAEPEEVASREEILFCLSDDLVANKGASLVVVGPTQPAAVHALANEINSLLGNIGTTVTYTELPDLGPERGTLTELVRQIGIGGVDTLVIIGGNPVYDAPADFEFGKLVAKVPNTIHLGFYRDETGLVCDWHVPACHPLECWSDALSYDGIVSIGQPMIEPLVESRSPLQLVAQLAGVTAPPQMIVRQAVGERMAAPLSTEQWTKLIHDGFGGESLLAEVTPELQENLPAIDSPTPDVVELVFTASSSVYDGRFANNGWLQESPDFITKVTWDNVARVSPATAKQLGVEHKPNQPHNVLRVQVGKASVELPVYVLPGQADGSIGVELGYGRTTAGVVGGKNWGDEPIESVGVNVYPLRTTAAPHFVVNVKTSPVARTIKLATTQDHFAIDTVGLEMLGNRIGQLVREAPLEHYKSHADFAKHVVHEVETPALFVEKEYENGNKWGMSIDLNKCIGCNACSIACQAENNIPVVGREQVSRGREMHWIRIDRYFSGAVDNPQVSTQPLPCMQCETAPCEQVCPVAATVHSNEGLNDMVYNRCIGTRYCANNCPYKVRRFNYFHFTRYLEEDGNSLMQLALNPEVTVRSRGVMEKCTYCVQRIAAARIPARAEGRPIADGEIQTACQQVCPTRAIEFGDLNDEKSVVLAKHNDPRAYGILTELKTKPRTLYLAKIRNPHPRLAAFYPVPKAHEAHDHAAGEHGHEGESADHEHAEVEA